MKEFLDTYLGVDWATYLSLFIGIAALFAGCKVVNSRKQVQKVGNNSTANQFGDNANVTINKKDN
ncbi:hypothetical protein [Vibrio parahaemolyticus]|uniref:hypothetical protein n=1 Tax=Vibrio parahaemolyticus TaxID=670 RepID=UPI0028F4531C|nr:hypothetical protein [Vibrio parahaemolyticus]WMP07554.1 hypothetical protein NI383_07180 [Vibrio parahaemolyticus]